MPFLPQTIPGLRLVLHTDASVRVPSPNSSRLRFLTPRPHQPWTQESRPPAPSFTEPSGKTP